jgi:hypothetical protein
MVMSPVDVINTPVGAPDSPKEMIGETLNAKAVN